MNAELFCPSMVFYAKVCFPLSHLSLPLSHPPFPPSSQARHLQYLRCPFDWSTINVFYLTRFSNLKHLTLEHYQTFQQLAQWKIQQLLDSLKLLRSLKISYISPSFTVRMLRCNTAPFYKRLSVGRSKSVCPS